MTRLHATSGFVACLLVATSAASSPAREPQGDDAYALPDVAAPPTLPDLTHRALSVAFDMTVTSVQPSTLPRASRPPRSLGWLERLEAEQNLGIRRFYLGAALGFAIGDAPPKIAVSQPEVWARAIWASPMGLAFGGGLGLVLPVFRYGESTREALIEGHVRVAKPWDYTSYGHDTFTFRPFVDVRVIDGPVLLQLRQGIDWAVSFDGEPLIASRTTLYGGYGIASVWQIGLEASEVYFIRAPNVNDEERATYTLSPSVRLVTRKVQPSLSAIFPLDQTVLGIADSFWAVRMQLAFVLD